MHTQAAPGSGVAPETPGRVRFRVRVTGIVQGVGFRPFVHALATRHELGGLVGNDAEGVFIEAEGDDEAALAAFLEALDTEAPPLAIVESLSCDRVAALGESSFVIVQSRDGGEHVALVSPDMATCDECRAEILEHKEEHDRDAGRNHCILD